MKKYSTYLVYGLYFTLLQIGLLYELSPYASGELSMADYKLVALSCLLLLLYALPLLYLFRQWQKRWKLPALLLPGAIGSGWLIAGWSAALGNDLLGQLLQGVLTDSETFASWEGALTAPIVEEPLKLLAALLVLFAFGLRSKQATLLAGAGAGLGFQLTEDISYAFHAVTENPDTALSATFARIGGSLTSHWMMTALVAVGVALLYSEIKKERTSGKALIFSTFFFHFVWNSPFASIETPFSIHLSLLSGSYCLLFFSVYRSLENQPLSSFTPK